VWRHGFGAVVRIDLVLYIVVIDVGRDDLDDSRMSVEDKNDEDRLGAEYAVAI
jgi:hypothetical protein